MENFFKTLQERHEQAKRDIQAEAFRLLAVDQLLRKTKTEAEKPVYSSSYIQGVLVF